MKMENLKEILLTIFSNSGEKILQKLAQHRYYSLNTYEIRKICVQIIN